MRQSLTRELLAEFLDAPGVETWEAVRLTAASLGIATADFAVERDAPDPPCEGCPYWDDLPDDITPGEDTAPAKGQG